MEQVDGHEDERLGAQHSQREGDDGSKTGQEVTLDFLTSPSSKKAGYLRAGNQTCTGFFHSTSRGIHRFSRNKVSSDSCLDNDQGARE